MVRKTKQAEGIAIQKTPGANTVDVVDRIKALMPKLAQSLPPSVHIDLMSDRSQTTRESIRDVQFTMTLTIALVVVVIFLFLRTMWATVIPSLAVPLSLLATFAFMYIGGYSIDNISLMGLTISVGFIVDDAIVMIENIVRYIEQGMRPFEAALKGAGQIGFTIISITLSLIAVFIPLLFMGGVIGRLFREFAVTISVAVVASAVISLISDAGDVLAVPEAGGAAPQRRLQSRLRARLPGGAERLRPRAHLHLPPPIVGAGGDAPADGRHRLPLREDSKGLLPPAGYRVHFR